MTAGPVPHGEDPFVPEGDVEATINDEGVWLLGRDVVALLERAGYDTALRQLRQMLEMLGEGPAVTVALALLAYGPAWDDAAPGGNLLALGGLIVGAVCIIGGFVRWLLNGDFMFWWNYERKIRVDKRPRR